MCRVDNEKLTICFVLIDAIKFNTHFHTLSIERYKTIDPLLTVTWFEIACVRIVIKCRLLRPDA